MSEFDAKLGLFQKRERQLIEQAKALKASDDSGSAEMIRARTRNLFNKYQALVKRRRFRAEIDRLDVQRADYLAKVLEQITPQSSSQSE